jgi:hypothetical protein
MREAKLWGMWVHSAAEPEGCWLRNAGERAQVWVGTEDEAQRMVHGGNIGGSGGLRYTAKKLFIGVPSAHDPVNHPHHYTAHPSGVECIQITEHMGFNLGNAVKYIWRADLKHDAIEDLKKAAWYLAREIERREKKTPVDTFNVSGGMQFSDASCRDPK